MECPLSAKSGHTWDQLQHYSEVNTMAGKTPKKSAKVAKKAAAKRVAAKAAKPEQDLEDPSGLFNSSLEGNTRRAIDFHEGDKIDERALKALIRAAVALNTSMRATGRPVPSKKRPKGV